MACDDGTQFWRSVCVTNNKSHFVCTMRFGHGGRRAGCERENNACGVGGSKGEDRISEEWIHASDALYEIMLQVCFIHSTLVTVTSEERPGDTGKREMGRGERK